MTVPKVETAWVHGDRHYVLDRDKFPGVSGILNMLPKPALMYWYAKMAAQFCVNNTEIIEALAANDRQAAIDLVKGAANREKTRAADAGTLAHSFTELLARDVLAGVKSTFRVGPEMMPFLRNYARFYHEFKVRPMLVETTVWSQEHRYAGTFDLLAELTIPDREDLQARGIAPGPQVAIIDTKTGASGVWAEAALQQTAYRRAGHYVDENGRLQPLPDVEATYGLWLRPEGWALIPLDSGPESWAEFLALRASYEWKIKREKLAVGKALNASPLTRKWKG